MITTADVRWACDVLRPTYDPTRRDGVDGRVSIEVDPRLAHDTEKTIAEARQLWRLVDRPNLFIKIPATTAGCRPSRLPVRRHQHQRDPDLLPAALRRGHGRLPRRYRAGPRRGPRPDRVGLGRLVLRQPRRHRDRPAARRHRLRRGQGAPWHGGDRQRPAGLPHYDEVFTADRWRTLARAGARPQRPLWASTGVKDPTYPDTRYVVDLVTRGVVNTMPEATLRAVADHGAVRGDTVRPGYHDAAEVMAALAEIGIDYDDVVDKLERDGLTTFQASDAAETWTQLAAASRDGKDGPCLTTRFAIVGAGLAGAKAAEALRDRRLRRTHRPARGRTPPALRAAAAVQGLPAGRRRPRHRLRAPAGVVRRPPDRPAARHRRHRNRPPRPRDRDRRRQPAALRQAAAGHRRSPAPAAGARRRPRTACITCAPSTTATSSRPRSARHPGSDHRRGLDRAGDRRSRPRGGRRGHRARARRAAAAARSRAPGGASVRRPAHASTASTCAAASPSAAIRPAGTDPTTAGAVLLTDGTDAGRRRRSSSASASPRTSSWPGPAGSTSTTASSSTSTCAPPTTTSSPQATSPTPTTRCWAGTPRRTLGQRAAPARRRRQDHARAAPPPTTGCPTSSPTSTTSAWSTPATRRPTATTRS